MLHWNRWIRRLREHSVVKSMFYSWHRDTSSVPNTTVRQLIATCISRALRDPRPVEHTLLTITQIKIILKKKNTTKLVLIFPYSTKAILKKLGTYTLCIHTHYIHIPHSYTSHTCIYNIYTTYTASNIRIYTKHNHVPHARTQPPLKQVRSVVMNINYAHKNATLKVSKDKSPNIN